jgi:MurNAc alpha-1-phosphate uridylyltransferase
MRHNPDALMLFAAGFGTRMGPLTKSLPKPLIEVAGRPLLDHALALAAPLGLKHVVINTHYRAEQIARHLSTQPKIKLSFESPGILETGGGLRHALPLLGTGPVFTLNTDAVWSGPNPLELLNSAWDPQEMDALLLLIPKPNALGHSGAGDFETDVDGRLVRGPGAIFSGAQILKTGDLAMIPDATFSLNVVWDRMLDRKRLFGLIYPGNWCDVGRPESVPLATRMLSNV